ncbi:Sideroflexin-4 [Apodemus speciosus]|uniref:Sideroflexin-4 n=1 Tax=Apodemus speciosus TaxID=105296 RepID=A0ABQ0FTM1_APOSI
MTLTGALRHRNFTLRGCLGPSNPLQSFFRRFCQWMDLLDPVNVFVSIGSIEKSRQLLFTTKDAPKHYLDNQGIKDAWNKSLGFPACDSTHGSSGFLYGYTTAFNITNGNTSYSHGPVERTLLGAGVFVSSTFFGVGHSLSLKEVRAGTLNRNLRAELLAILHSFTSDPGTHPQLMKLAQVGGINVFASRSFENHRGIEVMDKEGHAVGYSRKAGRKAIKETAKSRTLLFGTSALAPELFIQIFKRDTVLPTNSAVISDPANEFYILYNGTDGASVIQHVSTNWTGIQCSQLEEKIQSSTEEKELFYYRGV